MNLTEAEQRRLTEFLGECWHEPRTDTGPVELVHFGGSPRCAKCGERLDLNLPFNKHSHRLDFTDWRVVGRLIEKMMADGQYVMLIPFKNGAGVEISAHDRTTVYHEHGDTPQEAICHAVLARMEEMT